MLESNRSEGVTQRTGRRLAMDWIGLEVMRKKGRKEEKNGEEMGAL